MVKEKKPTKKNSRKSNGRNSISSDSILRTHLSQVTPKELKKLKTDESYKEGFLLAVSLMTAELKTIVYKKKATVNKK